MTKPWTRILSAVALSLGLSCVWVVDGQGIQRSQQQRSQQSGGSNYDRYGAPGDDAYREPGYFQQRQEQERNHSRYDGQNQGQNQGQNRTGYELIDGRIDSFRRAYLSNNRGYRSDHTLAKLQLQNGETAIVDLGPSQSLRRLNFQPGDRIQVRGQYAQVGRRQVVVAQQIKIDDTVTRIRQAPGRLSPERVEQSSQQHYSQSRQASPQGFGEEVTLSGRLDGFRHVNLSDDQDQAGQSSLARVRLENGRSAVVDLGPKKDLDDLNLETGDQIGIRGRRGAMNGRPVLHANRIRVDGETYKIRRSTADQRSTTAGRSTTGQRFTDDQRSTGGSQEDRDFTVRGTVRGYDLLSMRSGTNTLALLNLHLQDGRRILIDAGNEYTVGDFNLRKLKLADQIIIEGRQKTIEGKPVLVVESIGAVTPSEGSERAQIYDRGDSEDQRPPQDQETRSSPEREESQSF